MQPRPGLARRGWWAGRRVKRERVPGQLPDATKKEAHPALTPHDTGALGGDCSTHPPRAPPPDAGRCWPVISALARLLLLILSPLAHLLPIRLLTTVGAVSTGSDGVLNVSHPSFLITPNPAPRSPQAGRTLSRTGLDEAYRHPVPSAPFTLSSTTATKSCTRRCIPTLLVSLPALPTSPLPQPRYVSLFFSCQSAVTFPGLDRTPHPLPARQLWDCPCPFDMSTEAATRYLFWIEQTPSTNGLDGNDMDLSGGGMAERRTGRRVVYVVWRGYGWRRSSAALNWMRGCSRDAAYQVAAGFLRARDVSC
ncbi:hypothetical protein PSPO01_05304 [Paraphaeosphaeria sporulosa]